MDNGLANQTFDTNRKVNLLLSRYGESHQHPTNEKIHFVCVPVIMWTVLALAWSLHPVLALSLTGLALIYYASLSIGFAIGMSIMAAVMIGILHSMPQDLILTVAVVAFVIAWIFQFIGHKIEGKKPSFFEDLQFLLIGPLFVIGFLYRRWKLPY
nr:Mpo1-like protein [uncultured Undibacterium sp.]